VAGISFYFSLRRESSLANLNPERALALDDDVAVPLAQFDLANVPVAMTYEAGPKLI